jgi:pantothenate kinase, type III
MDTCALYFDIGNTNTKIGLRGKGKGFVTYVLPSGEHLTPDAFGLSLVSILRREGYEPAAVGYCLASSVVPEMDQIVSAACARFFPAPLLFSPGDLPVPLENRYARPHEVGADRLVGSYAARVLFPDTPSIISIDFGTATTFDCVEENAYLGGLICPGVFSSVAALASGTAKLPRINLVVEKAHPEPGLSTSTSLSHGFVFGFAAMAEGLSARLGATLKGPVAIVGTGGFADPLSRVTNCFSAVQPDLVLHGLRLLHDLQRV